jgi:hypothetical protein
VTGTYHYRFVTPTGVVDVPINLTNASVSALAPPNDTVYPGTGSSDGTFTIADVPEGPYYLKLNKRYLVLTANDVDLSFDIHGRPTARFATSPTPLTFDVTSMATWQADDELQLTSPAGTAAYFVEQTATAGAPVTNDTALSGMTFDLSRAAVPVLIDSSEGDELTLTQLSTQTVGARTYRSVARTFTPAPFSVTNGGAATLAGAFTTVDATKTLDVTWDRPAFSAELASHFPGASSQNLSTLAISALPDAGSRGYYSNAPDIVVYAPGYTTDSTAVTTAWPYGDPFPSDWTRIAWIRYYRYRFAAIPGSQSAPLYARMLTYRDLSTVTTAAPIEPIVGTVVSPMIEGMGALGSGSLSGVGTTPTISWTAPTLGTASLYYVLVYLVSVQNGATVLQQDSSFETSATSLQIPPGIMTDGQTYAFEIEARSIPGVDLSATPNRRALPEGVASVTTKFVTP